MSATFYKVPITFTLLFEVLDNGAWHCGVSRATPVKVLEYRQVMMIFKVVNENTERVRDNCFGT